MVWRRLPVSLPNIVLKLQPLSEAQQRVFEQTGSVRELIFRTTPNVTKTEVRAFLESVYGLDVAKVNTANYEGKKRASRTGFHRRTDYKKVYVTLQQRSFASSA